MEEIWITSNGLRKHSFFLGFTGRGRSPLMEQEAARLGISVTQLEAMNEPSEELKQKREVEVQQRRQMEVDRLKAVCQAYWDATPADSNEFGDIEDALLDHCQIDSPTRDQVRAVIFMLPSKIVGAGVQWGFGDSVVRDDIYKFVQENATAILASIQSGA